MKKTRYSGIVLMIISVLAAGLPVALAARDFQAVLGWADQQIVSFPVNGRVARVNVRAGDRVSAGALLIELDKEPFELRLGQFEAAVAAREPVLADAKREYDQAASLYEQTVLSDVELQRAKHTFEQARAELAQAKAALRLARWRFEQARAVAPWDAWVIQRSVEPGQVLTDEQRSTPLLVLAKIDAMTVSTLLPVAVIQALHIGQPVRVLIDNSSRDAMIVSLGMQPVTQGNESGYRLETRFPVTQDDVFRAGQAAVVQLP